MAKPKKCYACTVCGYESGQWYGRCPSCGAWNTLQEQIIIPENISAIRQSATVIGSDKLTDIDIKDECRYHTGIGELDRVLGGGIVKGSLVLLGGDPGIGKSTIMLQICEHLAKKLSVLYVSGEESKRQIKLRADRLGVKNENISIVAATDAVAVCEFIREQKPDIVIVDSVQTMSINEVSSSPGSVSQVRECTNLFLRTAKNYDVPIFIIGHVNKDGNIAGPKVIEHIVDAVLYFEGERNLPYRNLRAVKNRFGSTNEIGVFEMTDSGLSEVKNPSQMLLSGRPKGVSGTVVACNLEGTRPLLAEIQALVSTSGFGGNPRRMSTGFDYNRMNLIIAVLEKRAGYFFGGMDVYLNVVGGLRLDEPAADLPVALSIVSSLKDKAIDDSVVAFGEIGLGGEIRSVSRTAERVSETARLGFTKCIVPYANVSSLKKIEGIEIIGVKSVKQAVYMVLD